MSTTATSSIESEILTRALDRVGASAWQPLTQLVVDLKLADEDLDRADELLEKNRSDGLTDGEREELDRYLRVGMFLDLIRARALREREANGDA